LFNAFISQLSLFLFLECAAEFCVISFTPFYSFPCQLYSVSISSESHFCFMYCICYSPLLALILGCNHFVSIFVMSYSIKSNLIFSEKHYELKLCPLILLMPQFLFFPSKDCFMNSDKCISAVSYAYLANHYSIA
jgi:hypothetical protein